jgi:hypothetical protein
MTDPGVILVREGGTLTSGLSQAPSLLLTGWADTAVAPVNSSWQLTKTADDELPLGMRGFRE